MINLSYKYPVENLYTGSSLGNRFAFVQLDEMTNCAGVWSSTDNQFYLGEWKIVIASNGERMTPAHTTIRPASQTTTFQSKETSCDVEFLLPFSLDDQHAHDDSLRACIVVVRLQNGSSDMASFTINHALVFPGVPSSKFTKKPPDDQTEKTVHIQKSGNSFEIITQDNPKEARVFSSKESSAHSQFDDRSLSVDYEFAVPPLAGQEQSFLFVFSPSGIEEATTTLQRCEELNAIVDRTHQQYDELLSRTRIITPEPLINRGLQWAKVNTVRVQHQYRIGEGFTNDPPQDIVVIRDLAWYVLGSDYVTPTFSRGLLKLAGQFAFHDNGKLTEFIRADEPTPELHDYHLNINDDTPLYVYGLFHHAITSDGDAFLRDAYPLMKRACDYIITQIKDGLVHCHAGGTNVCGICGWRNIIDEYNLSGAVTEVNVECVYALRLLALTARRLGLDADADRYRNAADDLERNINKQLVSETTGLYLLNLGSDGVRHHDVTGDLIFPVMFGIPKPVLRRKILERLSSEEFWTPYGTRTVSPSEQNYDPDFGYQLVGGVWPNLTAWTAFCIRKERPDKLVEGMINIYQMSESPVPKDFVNVVPGEFPERLHGETFVSRGMAMSPWMPPTYLWLGVEGLLGLKPGFEGIEMTPAIPDSWKWIAVDRLLYKNQSISLFLFDGMMYSTHNIVSGYPVMIGQRVRTTSDNPSIVTIALSLDNGTTAAFVHADEAASGNIIFHVHPPVERGVLLKAGEAMLLTIVEPKEE